MSIDGVNRNSTVKDLLDLADEYYSSDNEEKRSNSFVVYQNVLLFESNNAYAMNRLGNCYAEGIGTPVNEEKAEEMYITAAELGNISAQYNYARRLYKKNDKMCISWFEKAMDNGDPDAADMLGDIYIEDIIVPKDVVKAVSYYKKAAEMGSVFALQDLGALYITGKDVPKDFTFGVSLLEKAYEKGSKHAAEYLSKVYFLTEDVDDHLALALEWAEKTADLGDGSQLSEYGEFLFNGTNGFQRDYQKAYSCFLKAADVNDVSSYYNCGICCLNGFGTEIDLDSAYEWFLKAAENDFEGATGPILSILKQKYANEYEEKYFEVIKKLALDGHAEASYKMYLLYRDGIGIEKDNEIALSYLEKAAEKEFDPALFVKANYYLYGMNGYAVNIEKAIELFKIVAENGNAEAANKLANLYFKGECVEQNDIESIKWRKIAFDNGDVEAYTFIGTMYQDRKRNILDYQKSFEYLQKAYEKGSANAALFLAFLYEDGKGVEIDQKKAFELCKIASENNIKSSFVNMGRYYYEGIGTEKNIEKAKEYLEKGKMLGDKKAEDFLNSINKLIEEQDLKNLDFLELKKLADLGDAEAQYLIYRAYLHGEKVGKNIEKAIYYCNLAADNNHPTALAILADLSLSNREFDKAIELFNRAYEKGNDFAGFRLGTFLLYGSGDSPIDKEKGFALISETAKKGIEEAECELGICYMMGNATQVNSSEAFNWLKKAAEKGYSKAQEKLGLLYYNGFGTNKDKEKAAYYYEKAANQGLSSAKITLANMLSKGDGVETNFKKACQLYLDIINNKDDEYYFDAVIECAELYETKFKDYSNAYKLYYLAAQEDNVEGQYHLGVMYSEGLVTPKNDSIAIYWLRLASKNGHQKASEKLDILLSKLYGNNYGSNSNLADEKNNSDGFNKNTEYSYSQVILDQTDLNEYGNKYVQKSQAIDSNKLGIKEIAIILGILAVIVLVALLLLLPSRNEEPVNKDNSNNNNSNSYSASSEYEENNLNYYSDDIETWTLLESYNEINNFKNLMPDVDSYDLDPILNHTWSNQNVLTLAFDAMYIYQCLFKDFDAKQYIDQNNVECIDDIFLKDAEYGESVTMGYYIPASDVENIMVKNAKEIFGIDKYVLRKSPFYSSLYDSYIYNTGLGGGFTDETYEIQKVVIYYGYAFVYQKSTASSRGCLSLMKESPSGKYYYLTNFAVKDMDKVLNNTFYNGSYEVVEPYNTVEPRIRYVTSGSGLRIRTGPSENYDPIITIPLDAPILCFGEENGWVYVRYLDIYGWMSEEYLN